MKMTFKQYLIEASALDTAIKLVKKFLGADVKKAEDFDDSVLQIAKEEHREVLDSPVGKWVVSIFKSGTNRFARVNLPLSKNLPPVFYVPKADQY